MALTGAIKDQLIHLDDIALYGLDFFARYYPERIANRYQLKAEEEALLAPDLLMKITENVGIKITMIEEASLLSLTFGKEN